MFTVHHINKYLEENDRQKNVGFLIKDKGEGSFIAKWEVDGLPEPTIEQLSLYTVDLQNERLAVDTLEALKRSDIEDVPRITEDIWKILVDTNVATESDLPEETRAKLSKRSQLRNAIRAYGGLK
jgi:hypothetical protein